MGLRGTGSFDYDVKEQFVEAGWTELMAMAAYLTEVAEDATGRRRSGARRS
jgi:hypothetical protein